MSSNSFLAVLIALSLVSFAGCNQRSYDVVPVSGSVTLYGEPLANATVSFEPKHAGEEGVVGPGSLGETDYDGNFTLRTHKGDRGAVVGRHTVRISTYKSKFTDFENSDEIEVVSIEHVPWHYNRNTQLEFDVPSEGTKEANFVLTAEQQ